MKVTMLRCAVGSLAVLMSVGFAACGGDGDSDEEGGHGRTPGGKTPAGSINTKTGQVRLTQVDNFRFFYDEDGRISSITEYNYPEASFSYSPNKIFLGEDGDEEATISYTNAGYVSKMNEDISFTEDGQKYSLKGTISMSYDGSGHLTSFTGSGTEKGTENGYPYTWTTSFKATLKWSSCLLRSIRYTMKEKDTGGGEKDYTFNQEKSHTFDYDSSQADDYLNTYEQWAPSLTLVIDDVFMAMAYVGLLGKGPQYLPSASNRTSVNEENGEEKENKSYNYSHQYRFNDDGTLSVSYNNSTSSRFYYTHVADTRASLAQPLGKQQKAELFRALFGMKHGRHSAK